jgi:thioredoxin 2
MTDKAEVKCPNCSTRNRVPIDRLQRGEQPVCGKCQTPLPVFTKPVTVTDATFHRDVEESSLPVVVDLWAAWCGPCRMLAPILDELALEMVGRAKFTKLNIDENRLTAQRFNVSGIPTLLVFKNGRLVDQITGLVPKAALSAQLQKFVA